MKINKKNKNIALKLKIKKDKNIALKLKENKQKKLKYCTQIENKKR